MVCCEHYEKITSGTIKQAITMANDDKHSTGGSSIQQEFAALQNDMNQLMQKLVDPKFTDKRHYLKNIYYLWALWADFHLHITRPVIEARGAVRIIQPTVDSSGAVENVYPIFDYGNVLSASRGEDLVKGLRCMGKLYNTIEKMIRLLLGRVSAYLEIDEDEGGSSAEERKGVAVAFRGHELAQRKAYVAITSLNKNIEVVNFQPGAWAKQLQLIQQITEQLQESSRPVLRS